MNNLKILGLVIFADLAFLICNVLTAGYLFVSLKKQDVVQAESNNRLQKDVELPILDEADDFKSKHLSDQSVIGITLRKEGGYFFIDDKSIRKSELNATLKGLKGHTCDVNIDQRAPTGDSLFLFEMLNKHEIKFSITFIPGEK